MIERKKHSLIQGKIFPALLFFALPMVLGSLIQQLYITADAVIVGQFAGKMGLAAIDSVHTLFRFPINFMNGLTSGAAILISGYFGAKDGEGLHRSIRTAWTTAVILGLLCSILGFLLAPQFLDLLCVPEEIYADALAYTRIYFAGLWTMVLYNMSAGILRSFGDSQRPLYVLILCSLVNVLADFLLVGVLHMGVRGAAAATVAAQFVSVAVTAHLLSKREREHGHEGFFLPYFHKAHFSSMLKTGIPLALQSMLFPLANTIVQASVNTMGTDSIAAWGICDKMDMLIWLIADAMGPALTTFTAQNLGANQPQRVKSGAFIGAGISAGAVAGVSLILYLFCGTIGKWFVAASDAVTLMPLVIRYMRMMAPFFLFYALAEAFSGACCGLGDTILPMITTLVTICLLRVVSILFILPSFGTMECIVWIYIASWIAAGTAFTGMFVWKTANLSPKSKG